MCGIIGAVANKPVAPILLEGLKRLEYRGYDSAGLAIIDLNQQILCYRVLGKVEKLIDLVTPYALKGHTGIAHTRWATHGKPSHRNAHPHLAGDEIALVHNGIIENHEILRARLLAQGCILTSDTDSELIAHLVYLQIKAGKDFLTAVRVTAAELQGAFSIAFIHKTEPGRLIAVRNGSPLVIGLGEDENFIASDKLALLSVTHQFIYLEENDIADVRQNNITIYDANGSQVDRQVHQSDADQQVTSKDNYSHFMWKEILEQPHTVSAALEGRITDRHVLIDSFGPNAKEIFSRIKRVQIVACGTSYHAGLVGRYWLEQIAGVPCQVEIASENRYREGVIEPDTLFVTLSQSGETADTLAALRQAKKDGYAATLAICNVPDSTLSRESDMVFMMRAGVEIGVASTKSFTSQLIALLLLTITIGRFHRLDEKNETALVQLIKTLPEKIQQTLLLDPLIQKLAMHVAKQQHVIFLGRNIQFPIALEAALKLKEISYIHADAYPAGELKHGPLALVDVEMMVIALAPTTELIHKLKSNLQEVLARNGKLIVITDQASGIEATNETWVLKMLSVDALVAPIIYIIPTQLLAYHVGVIKGINVDQPRNLAKSVTVE